MCALIAESVLLEAEHKIWWVFFPFSILAHENVKGINTCLPAEFQQNVRNFNALNLSV